MPKPTHTPSKADVKIGRFLSMVLRHKPQALGIRLDGGGWVEVDVLHGKGYKQHGNLPNDSGVYREMADFFNWR